LHFTRIFLSGVLAVVGLPFMAQLFVQYLFIKMQHVNSILLHSIG